MRFIQIHLCSVLIVVVLCAGCGAGKGSGTYPVTGKVTLSGAPAAGVAVSFIPDGGGQSAVGVTDDAGQYSLTTVTKDDGAKPGQYKVTLAKYEGGPAASPEPSDSGAKVHADYDIADEYPEGYNESAAASAPPAKNLLPDRYADPNTSGFTADVAESPNTHNFDLKG